MNKTLNHKYGRREAAGSSAEHQLEELGRRRRTGRRRTGKRDTSFRRVKVEDTSGTRATSSRDKLGQDGNGTVEGVVLVERRRKAFHRLL